MATQSAIVSCSTITFSLILAGSIISPVMAGPEWDEDFFVTDAGELPGIAQTVQDPGGGAVLKIHGKLDGMNSLAGIGDFQDMYLIMIKDPASFSASTIPGLGGSATFDTQLWLFDATTQLGILGNDDDPSGPPGSTLFNAANDLSGAAVVFPGLYYLAISGFNSDPFSLGGAIFNQAIPTEFSGPDGPGGLQPIIGWNPQNGDFGEYEIALTGVSFIVPGPSVLGLFVFVGLTSRRRRRR